MLDVVTMGPLGRMNQWIESEFGFVVVIGGNNSKESRDRDINPKNPWDVSRGVMLSPVSRPQACHFGGLVFLILIWRGPDCWGRWIYSFWGDSTMQIYDDFEPFSTYTLWNYYRYSCWWFINPAPVDMVKSPMVYQGILHFQVVFSRISEPSTDSSYQLPQNIASTEAQVAPLRYRTAKVGSELPSSE